MPAISILHIDDNAGDLTLAREALRAHDVRYEGIDEPVTAVGKLAKDCTEGRAPTAILLDLNLAAMDGYDVLRLLGSNQILRRVPVIVLTSSDREQERAECLRLGARAYLVKPATFEELSALLAKTVAELAKRPRRAAQQAAAAASSSAVPAGDA